MAMSESQFEAYKRDLLYRSLDRIMIYNPTQTPFKLIWDGFIQFTIQPKQKLPVYRWQADHYAKQMSTQIIHGMADRKLKETLESRASKGFPEITKYEEQNIVPNLPKTDNPELLAQIYETLILGIIERYEPQRADSELERVPDVKSIEERILEMTERPFVEEKAEIKSSEEPYIKEEVKPKGK